MIEPEAFQRIVQAPVVVFAGLLVEFEKLAEKKIWSLLNLATLSVSSELETERPDPEV